MSNSIDLITRPFYIDGLYVEPSQNTIIIKNQAHNIQPKVMEVLLYLCTKKQELVTNDQLIKACWPNQYIGDSPLHKCIAQLRKVLGDDPRAPRFIKTIPKKGYVFIAAVKGLDLTNNLTPQMWLGSSPYPGLDSFCFEQSQFFFGREKVIEDIESWIDQKNAAEDMWLLLSAPKNTGKSSLVNAGLLPSIVRRFFIDTENQDFCVTLNLADKLEGGCFHSELICLLLGYNFLSKSLSVADYTSIISQEVNGSEKVDGMELFISNIIIKDNDKRLVIFIDHLETLFDPNNKILEYDKACLFLLLKWLVNSKRCFLITVVDANHLDDIFSLIPADIEILDFKVPLFSYSELVDIINKPAQLAGINFEYDKESREYLNGTILRQISEAMIPISVLQFLLGQLYQKRNKQTLTIKAYNEIGGLLGCILERAERTYVDFSEEEIKQFELSLFYLIHINKSSEVVRRACPVIELAEINVLPLIDKLIGCGVLCLGSKNSTTVINISHQSLISRWNRLAGWVEKNKRFLSLSYDLKSATVLWLRSKKNKDFLLQSSSQIAELSQLIANTSYIFNDEEKALVRGSKRSLVQKRSLKKLLVSFSVLVLLSFTLLSVSLNHKQEQASLSRYQTDSFISFILYDLKKKLEPLGKVELLNMLAVKIFNYFEQLEPEEFKGKVLYQWVETLHILGEVNISKSDYKKAEFYLNKATPVLEKALIEDRLNEKLLELIMLTNYWLGYAAYLQLDYVSAKPFFLNYYKYSTDLVNVSHDTHWRIEQSYALNNLGALANKQNQLIAASDYFEQSALIKLSLLEMTPRNINLVRELVDTYSWQSNIKAKSGQLLKSISLLNKALLQFLDVVSVAGESKNTENLADIEHKLALSYFNIGDLDNALYFSLIAELKFNKLTVNDSENYLYKEDLLWNYLLSVKIYIQQSKSDAALIYLDKAKELLHQFKLLEPTQASDANNKSIIRAKVYILELEARIMLLLGQKQNALVIINKALRLFSKYLSKDIEATYFTRLSLLRIYIEQILGEKGAILIRHELIAIKAHIETMFNITKPNFELLFMYISTEKFMKRLKISPDIGFNTDWLNFYLESDYNIPATLQLNLNMELKE